MAAPRILAVAYGGGHIAMLLPVLRALRARLPGLHVDLLALTTARRVAQLQGESPLGYAELLHLLNDSERERALALGAALQDGNSHPDITAAETRAYLGVNALDLELQLGADAARQLLRERGRHGFYPIRFFERVIAALRPDLVLATNSPRSEQAAVDAAAAAGVPSLAVLDLFGLPGDAFAARTAHPDRVCVLAPAVADNLVAAGWPRERIRVTGNPAFDALHSGEARAAARQLRQRLGWQRRRAVLLAAQPEPRDHPDTRWGAGDALALALEAQLRAWVAQRPDCALLVRHHPNAWHRLPRLPDTDAVHFSVPGEEAIEPLLLAADAVVVQTTTVGLQAATLGIPVLSMRCSPGARGGLDYAALGIARGVALVDDLPRELDALLADPPAPTAWARPRLAADAVAQETIDLLPRN
jgi:hypothetical protein